MQIAPEITFEGSQSSEAARAQILSEIEKLEFHNQRITGLDARHQHANVAIRDAFASARRQVDALAA